uniref:Uncharacterized protein n=1 Tax=Panagrolaimus superbus TaxID=310955 RepID=A0A914Y867_9BILA
MKVNLNIEWIVKNAANGVLKCPQTVLVNSQNLLKTGSSAKIVKSHLEVKHAMSSILKKLANGENYA